MGDVQRQQGLVLFDQGRAAAKVDVHVPQPGNQIAAAAIDGGDRAPLSAQLCIIADGDNAAVTDGDGLVGYRATVFDIDHGCMAYHYVGLGLGGDCGRDGCCECGQQQAEGGLHRWFQW